MMKIITIILGLGLLAACGSDADRKKMPEATQNILTEAEALLQQTFVAHGGTRYEDAHYQFIFRDKQYEFKNGAAGYMYRRTQSRNDTTWIDVLENGKLSRSINDKTISLSEKDQAKYTESVNSVIYFATLPHKLLDPAVNLKIVGEASIKNKSYDILQVTFDQDGGGEDFDDQFHYWINKDDHTIDYLAYNYKTNEGGVRFRSAYNRREVDGIIFQDYVNYKAEIGTPLIDLPGLYEKDELKELSRIETEDIINLK